jgi:hypothetical protein
MREAVTAPAKRQRQEEQGEEDGGELAIFDLAGVLAHRADELQGAIPPRG